MTSIPAAWSALTISLNSRDAAAGSEPPPGAVREPKRAMGAKKERWEEPHTLVMCARALGARWNSSSSYLRGRRKG